MLCREQAAQLRARADEFERRGAALVLIGQGSTRHARHFQERYAGGLAVYTDPDRCSYAAIGAVRGIRSTLAPRSAVAYTRAFLRGHRQGRAQGDPVQEGGVFVVRPGGRVVYSYLSRFAGDHPPIDEVLQALG